jgi:hypothetical protein
MEVAMRSGPVARIGWWAALALVGCGKSTTPTPEPTPVKVTRCELDLTKLGVTSATGASAQVIASPSDLIGGEAAQGRLGDLLLKNDLIRVVIQQPGRSIAVDPYGGAILDADTVHAGPGNDKFGKMALFFNFGRTVNPQAVEVLASGAQGGAAVIAATGTDEVNDYLNIKGVLGNFLPGTALSVDPDAKVGLRVTTYYALLPGSKHVTVVSALCNLSDADTRVAVGDLIDSGGDVALFNPQAGTGGFGFQNAPDPMSWVGWMASDNSIAYGVAPWKVDDLNTPETHSNALTVVGVTGYVLGNKAGFDGLIDWTVTAGAKKSGGVFIPAHGSIVMGREFVVGSDLGDVASTIESVRAAKTGEGLGKFHGVVSDASGPVAGARVVVERPDTDHAGSTFRSAVLVTDAQGKFGGQLSPATYTLTAWKQGRAVSQPAVAAVAAGGDVAATLTLGATHVLTVHVADEAGHAVPGKVTVRCVGTCPAPTSALVRFDDQFSDPQPQDLQLVGFIPPSGTETFDLPAAQYEVMVSHGPEYSLWPLTSPGAGAAVDLTAADVSVSAVVAHVVDTKGWMSADFHVHSVNSPDSPVPLVNRVKTFLAEGVDVLLSTDHDYVTDYAPSNQAVGGTDLMATMIGVETTSFDYGHFNPFPLTQDASDPVTHGAIDWAGGSLDGGDAPSLPINDIIKAARARGATTFQINHPNGNMSTFGNGLLDADTLATHQSLANFRLPPNPKATATDTGLFPTEKWDAMEVMNGFSTSSFMGLINNWMTFNANGLRVTGTAVSDTHHRWSAAAGYPRSYVRMNKDVHAFDPAVMSQGVNQHHVQGSLGLFVKAYAFKGGTAPSLAAGAVDLDAACAAAGAGCAQVGDTLAADAAGVDLLVDVQSPAWVPFDSIEVMNHLAARPMKNGVANSTFGGASGTATDPANGYWKQPVTLSDTGPEAEVVFTGDTHLGCGQASCQAKRWHVQKAFSLTGADAPAADDFFFVVVRDTNAAHNLGPVVYDGAVTSGVPVAQPATAFAFTNALYVDRDGNGYDHFPGIQASRKTSAPPPPAPRTALGSGAQAGADAGQKPGKDFRPGPRPALPLREGLARMLEEVVQE